MRLDPDSTFRKFDEVRLSAQHVQAAFNRHAKAATIRPRVTDLRRKVDSLVTVLPKSVGSQGNLLRHVGFLEHYLYRDDTHSCQHDIEDILRRDLPDLEDVFRSRLAANPRGARRTYTKYFDAARFHPTITEVSRPLFLDGHFSQAIFEATKLLENVVRQRSGLRDLDGQKLMAAAFSDNAPPLALNPLKSRSDINEQAGFRFLFMGVMTGVRNPKAHDRVNLSDPHRALQYLALINLLVARAEEATVRF